MKKWNYTINFFSRTTIFFLLLLHHQLFIYICHYLFFFQASLHTGFVTGRGTRRSTKHIIVYLRPCRLKNKYLLAVAVFYYVHLPQTKGKLKQVGKNGILVVENIKTMKGLFLFLDKMKKAAVK